MGGLTRSEIDKVCKMRDQTPRFSHEQPAEPVLLRTLEAAGLPTNGSFTPKAGWVSRAWIGDDIIVRVNNREQFRDAYRHEARVVDLLDGTEVPHARHIADGDGPDGTWYVSERLPGRTLHEAWPSMDSGTRRSTIESLGAALHALHRVPAPEGLRPPWMIDALAGDPWPAFHPPTVDAALHHLDAAQQRPDRDEQLLAIVSDWIHDRLVLFARDEPVLVHGDVHGSNVMVDQGRVTGLIDFAEALAQAADAELDTILRWCALASAYPPTPAGQGLSPSSLAQVPEWLRGAYPDLFASGHLRERLNFYDMNRELALYAQLPLPDGRSAARERILRVLDGRNHLTELFESGPSAGS
ncbi:aminoglycoside phosphotransferase family protein [Microbacterium sp. M28]|uniref:phosphotransferase family protein n=1 Tax=Microbacterium sp. M28 TaxID=2962064 RepID=UPI0021F3E844|nr:aminoglycoside phosphotransferase family protein [Microbacterium sp. M28]UYO95778.1 aminoglycoside phosphotransferase family protein [Microbacterium sp. M28]